MAKAQFNFLQDAAPPVRWALGLVAALAAFGMALLVPASHRPPYLFAYPAVVLSAWFFGVGAAISCAVTSGAVIELFALYGHLTAFQLVPQHSAYRLLVFLVGSITVTWLTQQISRLREQKATEELRRQLEVAAVEQRLADERVRAQVALRERETRLQMALRGGQIGLWDLDIATGSLLWSDEHYRILGLEPGCVPPSYEVMRDAIHPDDRAAMEKLFHSTRAEGKSLYCEYRVVRPDGSVAWVEAEGQYEVNSAGESVRMLGVLIDITRRKQAEAALLQSEKLAVAGRLAASVAHEINNPLAAVANLMYLIKHADSLDAAREHAEAALKQVMRVAHITRQTLKFHKQNEASRVVHLSEETESVLSLFDGKLKQSGVTVERRYEDDPAVECFSGDLRQVFANLVVNALDAMPRGGRLAIRIRWSVDWKTRTESGMRVTIADTGEGMTPEVESRIYEPFFTTKGSAGTGLGMWVTAQIIDRMRGGVSVWSSRIQGRSGTVFSVFLPFHRSPAGVAVMGGEEEPEPEPVP